MTLGEKLRTARIENELTLREAAEQVGINYAYLSRLETDQKQPSLTTLKALAKLYSTSLDDLAQ